MSTLVLAPSFHADAPARPAERRSQVRLTRRGRLVVLAFAFAVVASLAVLVAAGSAAERAGGGAPAVEVVTVAPGESLWSIASDVAAATGDDVRSAMTQIEQLNTLDSSLVYAGQELRVPSS